MAKPLRVSTVRKAVQQPPMFFVARWFNGLGEQTHSVVRALFDGPESGKQHVVVWCPRSREYRVLDVEDVELQ